MGFRPRTNACKKGLVIKNTFGGIGGEMTVGEKGGTDFFTCSKKNALCGDFCSNDLLPQSEGCALVGKKVSINSGESASFEFFLAYSPVNAAEDRLVSGNTVTVKTGDRELDELVNYWLPKQIIEGRYFGRTGFYQSS